MTYSIPSTNSLMFLIFLLVQVDDEVEVSGLTEDK